MSENNRRVLQRDPRPHLLRPVRFRSVESRNGVMFSPMCEYSGVDGRATDWHLAHLGSRAVGGAGIVFTESVHTEPRGRITRHCLGLWNDEQRDALAPIARFVAAQGAVPAIQIGHAGRKASVTRPWEGTKPLSPEDEGWQAVAPSALAYAAGGPVPEELDRAGIFRVIQATADAVRRAREAGFSIVELHGAHGYLIHQFLSPLSNRRDDGYGGSFDNRIRFLMETVEAARGEWPDDLPLFVRLSATEWVAGGWDMSDTLELVRRLKAGGKVDLIDVSSGGNDPRQQIAIHPGYQVPLSALVRRETGMATSAVGLIHGADMAEQIVANGDADLVAIGRAMMADPYWTLNAARALRAEWPWPVQYERSNIY